MKNIIKRRSIRKYTDEKISEESMNTLLQAAMYAPSAGNQQPWEFIVVRDKDTHLAITEFHQYASMLKYADAAILVCARSKELRFPDLWVQDCSAATQNILLAAESMGIGGVWLGCYPEPERLKKLQELFNLPEDIIPFSIVSLGYPVDEKPVPERFDPQRVHQEKW